MYLDFSTAKFTISPFRITAYTVRLLYSITYRATFEYGSSITFAKYSL